MFDPDKPDDNLVYSSLLGFIRISGVSALKLPIKVININTDSTNFLVIFCLQFEVTANKLCPNDYPDHVWMTMFCW